MATCHVCQIEKPNFDSFNIAVNSEVLMKSAKSKLPLTDNDARLDYNDLEDVESVINADLRSSDFPTEKIESLSENEVCTLSQARISNFARDMDTGLLMEYRPYGHGYPNWVGDWIPVGEPLESTVESRTDKDNKNNDNTTKRSRSDQPGRTSPGAGI